ncbi:MAG: preprotein translocase subunit SecE [Elusimicrobia bacterium RIFCSPLOWO2_01_FULL_54_10]|nr:MAG: preprotein translocase subunit SecE [Elusimicrobia bacterium RIFCSPLOWO2_01_FULL_54_10]
MIEQLTSFFKESYAELQKVTWISRKEVMGSTVVIIILVGILSVFVALMDMLFARIISWII